MKKNNHFRFIGMLLIGALLFFSCSKQVPENMAVIPKETNVVSVINLYSLAQKGKLNDISERKFFQTMKKEIQSENKKLSKLVDDIVEDPGITGMDVKTDIFGYYVTEKENEYGCLSVKLNNEEKFGNFITELLKELEIDFDIEKEQNYRFILVQSDLVVAWDAKKALFLTALSYSGRKGMGAEIETLMTLKPEDQMTGNDDFRKFYENKKDISVWLSANVLDDYLLEVLSEVSGMDYADSYVSAYFNFEKGKISLSAQLIPNEELKKTMKEYGGKTISFNDNLLEYLPATSYAAISMTFDPAVFYSVFQKERKFDDMRTMFEEELGMDVKEFAESFKGSVLFSLFDFNVNEMQPVMGLVFDINGSRTIEKVIEKAEAFGTKQNGYYRFDLDGITLYAAFNEKACLLTNDKKSVEAFQNNGFGKESLTQSPIKTGLTKNTFYGYWNLNFGEYPEIVKEIVKTTFGNDVFKLWNGFVRNVEFRSMDTMSSEFILHLQDDTNNSLYSIIHYTDNIYNEVMP